MGWGAFHPSRATTVAVVLLVFSFILMTLRLTQPVRSFRLFVYYLIAPSPEAASHLIHSTGKLAARLAHIVRIDREKAALEKKMRQLLILESEAPSLLLENQRLRELLNLKAKLNHEVIPAEVSARDVQNWFDSLWINQGISQGVQPDSPVLAISENPVPMAGLVGRILECGPNSSKVLLLSDSLSAVAALLPRTGEHGLVTGQGLFSIIIDYLDPASDIQPGDEVVTSGLGTIFPAGLLIGQVEKITAMPSGFKRAKIKTAASLSKIREVLILSPNGYKIPNTLAEQGGVRR